MNDGFRCGYVALIGKPNTGKSTLMNALVGEKLSITAHRPQTTRHQILGILTREDYQCIFVDTPGIHDNNRKAIHRYMNRAATSMLDDADLICLMLDITRFDAETLTIKPAPVSLRPIINDLVRDFDEAATERQIEITTYQEEDTPNINAVQG